MKNGWWLTGAGIITTALIIVGCMIIFTSDRKAPEIIMQDIQITYTEGDKDDVLLQGVTAIDKKDGDVTDSLIVEGIVISENGKQAKICYVAKDDSNNISRAYRIVNYVATGATNGDVTDGGENSGEKETESQGGSQQATQAPTKAPSQNQTQSNNGESQSAVASGERPVLVLKVSEATLKVGQTFNVVSYVADIADNKDGRSDLFKRIIADGNCDTGKVGDYTITVYCSDSDMNYSDKHTLIVHVTE